MNGDFIIVSKEEAIRKIMEAPGDTVIIGKISFINQSQYVHEPSAKSKKKEGKRLIIAANEIEYQNNSYFGTLSLHGIKDETVIHNILFPQLE